MLSKAKFLNPIIPDGNFMRKAFIAVLGLVFMAGLIFSAYTWISLSWSYSTGERAGLMQKISRKGWLCKTWEGELLLTSMPGAIPEKFVFSVRDDELEIS